MASIEVQVETAAWRKAWPRMIAETREVLRLAADHPSLVKKSPGLTRRPRGSASGARAGGRVKPGYDGIEVAVVFADDVRLRALNSRFRGKDKPTNVLSFPDGENPPGGGIALSFETVWAEAKAQGKPFVHHSKHMILHGFLHLLGFDHEKTAERRLMEGLEIAILSDMGIPNPYLIEAKGRA